MVRQSVSIASALHYLHSQTPQIVHGDVHVVSLPRNISLLSSILTNGHLQRNIVIDLEGNGLLIDFGLARIKHDVPRSKTNMGIGGMYRYLAPELYSSLLLDGQFLTSAASDAYALGMTILEMLTLEHPYSEYKSAHAAAHRALGGVRPARPRCLEKLLPNAADLLWRLLQDLWAHDPQNRASLDVAEARLREILLLPMTPIHGLH